MGIAIQTFLIWCKRILEYDELFPTNRTKCNDKPGSSGKRRSSLTLNMQRSSALEPSLLLKKLEEQLNG